MCLQKNLCDSWSLILLSFMWVFNFTTVHSPNGENLNFKSTILKIMWGLLHMSMFDCEEHPPVKLMGCREEGKAEKLLSPESGKVHCSTVSIPGQSAQ